MTTQVRQECWEICVAGEDVLTNAFIQAGLSSKAFELWNSVHQMLYHPDDQQSLAALCEQLQNLSGHVEFRKKQIDHLAELGLSHLLCELGLSEAQIQAVLHCLATVPMHA